MEVWLIDWEASSYTSPAFDVAFAVSPGAGICSSEIEQRAFLESYQKAGGTLPAEFRFYVALDALNQAVNALSNGRPYEQPLGVALKA